MMTYDDVAGRVMCVREMCLKGSVGRAHLGQMPLVEKPYSKICVDLVIPLSPPSEGSSVKTGY